MAAAGGRSPDAGRVVAVVVTFNRRELLFECLEALERQTRPVDRVIVVDNASTDGTVEALRASDLGTRLDLVLLPLTRNGGGAEGFHYGTRAALEDGADWAWLMDDDCAPAPDALERLLSADAAGDPATVLLAGEVVSAAGARLPLNRGVLRRRWFFAPLVALPDEEYDRDEVEIGFCSFVGPLVRASAARRIDLPLRRVFIRWDDVEYVLRLRQLGRAMLVPGSRIAHMDVEPLEGASLRDRWRDYRRANPFGSEWKQLYGLRNMVFMCRRHGLMNAGQAAAYALTHIVRVLATGDRRLRLAGLAVRYAVDGWRGRFLTVVPRDWAALRDARRPVQELRARALRYDFDARLPAERLGAPVGSR